MMHSLVIQPVPEPSFKALNLLVHNIDTLIIQMWKFNTLIPYTERMKGYHDSSLISILYS